MINMARKEIRKQANKREDKQTRKQKKSWCPQGTNVGLDRMSITSLCLSMDDTLASKTHAWTCKQESKNA